MNLIAIKFIILTFTTIILASNDNTRIEKSHIYPINSVKCKDSDLYVDYDGVIEGLELARIDICFRVTESFDLEWYFNGTRLNQTKKYEQNCREYDYNKYHCNLLIKSYNKKDVGEYMIFGKLKEKPEKNFRRYVRLIKPSKKDDKKKKIKKSKLIVIIVSIFSILVILLICILIYQKRKHDLLKKKWENLVNFMNSGYNEIKNFDYIELINTKENIEKLKFDDKKWNLSEDSFIIYDNRILGEGNFGKVLLALVKKSKNNDKFLGIRNTLLNEHQHTKSKCFPDFVSKFRKKKENNNNIDVSLSLLNEFELAAVKIVKDNGIKEKNLESLLQELKILGFIGNHLNIIELVGCFTNKIITNGIAYLFVNYCSNGDLNTWLKKHKEKYIGNSVKNTLINYMNKHLSNALYETKNEYELPENTSLLFDYYDLLFFCFQIAKGMEFLANKKCLHRDLAARNILLGEYFDCKISDFGLADQSKLTSQAYFGRVNGHIPLKWSAPEAIIGHKYESNSDVWSFGVVMWEIFSLCDSDPYPLISNYEFIEYIKKIKNGEVKPELPPNGTDEINFIIKSCWTVDPFLRPTFQVIASQLQNLLTEIQKKYYNLLNERFRQKKQNAIIREVSIQNADKIITNSLMINKSTNSMLIDEDQYKNDGSLSDISISIKSSNFPKPFERNQLRSKVNNSYLEPLNLV